MDVGRTRNWPASKEFARAEVYLALPPRSLPCSTAPGGLRGGECAAAAAPGGEDDCDADSLVGGRYGTLKDAMMPSWPWYYQVWLRKWAAESVRAMAGNRSFGTRRSRLPVPAVAVSVHCGRVVGFGAGDILTACRAVHRASRGLHTKGGACRR